MKDRQNLIEQMSVFINTETLSKDAIAVSCASVAERFAVNERENILTKYHRYLQDNLCLDLNVIWVKEFLKEREYYDGFRNKL